MKTRKIRLLSALLALAMMMALLPTAAFAADDEPATSGSCGKDGSDIKWELVGDTLTISGTGEMADYETKRVDHVIGTAPWYALREQIKSVVVANGVTNIGDYSFYELDCLESFAAPGITHIGESAFCYCKSLKTVDFSTMPNLTSIDKYAFDGSGITSITIPAGVTTIGSDAFYWCLELKSVDLNNATALKEIGMYAFANCLALEKVELPQNGILETIGECAFGSDLQAQPELAPKITEIKIPASVKVIGEQAFLFCNELSKVFFAANSQLTTMGAGAFENQRVDTTLFYTDDENVKQLLLQTMGWMIEETDILPLPQPTPRPDPVPETYPITIDYGAAYNADGEAIEKAAAGEVVTIEADETVFDGMVFEYWKDHNGNVTITNDHAAKTNFTMPAGEVHLEAMPKVQNDDSSWDAATVVTGVAIGTGTAILAYHIGTELYAEQVLGKGVPVPRTRAEVALLAWQLAGKPAAAVEGEPLSEAAQAQRWAVESGLMQNDAEGGFNGAKKMSKLKALRTLEKAKQ